MSPPILPYVLSPHVAPLAVRDGQLVHLAPRRRKVAICGAPGTREMPWDDPTFECWALNNFYNEARDREGRLAASRWFEQHQITPDRDGPDAGRTIQDAHDMEWIRTCPVPLYTTEPVPENPNAIVWPIESFARRYRDYFACSFAMQIVQALDDGFEELHVYGLELLLGTQREATVESSCVSYWLGFVEGRGMRLVIPDHPPLTGRSPLLGRRLEQPGRPQWLLRHPYWYGHEYWPERRSVEQYLYRWSERPVAI